MSGCSIKSPYIYFLGRHDRGTNKKSSFNFSSGNRIWTGLDAHPITAGTGKDLRASIAYFS